MEKGMIRFGTTLLHIFMCNIYYRDENKLEVNL